MPTVELLNMQGEQVGEIELDPRIFDREVKMSLIHDVVRMLLNNRRRGTASTKTRSEVSGGGRKPWRQKGTGRARHGSIRSPIWKGGGIVFGPKPRDYRFVLPKKVRRAALCSALSAKLQDNQLTVLDQLKLDQPKTKEIARLLQNLNVEGKALLVTAGPDLNVYRSGRNIPGLKTIVARQLNVLDIINHDRLILTKDAVASVEEVFAS
ncbi:MAG: 50S ribosomal protein L4 [Bacillota bacterium]